MIVQEHVFILGRCKFCRADRYSGDPLPDCKERDDYLGKPRPAPALRQLACEDVDAIRAGMQAIRNNEGERCPNGHPMTAHACLRTISRCPETCPAHDMWRGPEKSAAPEAGAFC